MSESCESHDVRLVPVALSAWSGAIWVTGSPGAAHLVVVSATITVAMAALLIARRHLGSSAGGVLLCLVTLGVVLASGVAQARTADRGGLALLVDEGAVVTLTGVLLTDAEAAPAPWAPTAPRYRMVLGVDSVTARGTTSPAGASVLVTAPGPSAGLVRGATVRVRGRLAAPDLSGPGASGAIAAVSVEVLHGATGIDAVVARARGGLLEVTAALDPQARGLVPGMTIGDTSRLPADLDRAMRTVGLTHLTAVSGTHVAVVALVVGAFAVSLRAPRPVRALALCLGVGCFVLLVHPEPSVLRAAVMGVVGIGGLVLGRRSTALPALAASVVVLVLADPSIARSVGFTLSVLATAAIVVLAVPASKAVPALPRWLAQAFTVPLAAQSACGPLLVLMDPAVSLWAVPANLAAAPAVLPATVLGLLATAAQPLSPVLAVVLARGAGLATGWISIVATTGASLPGARFDWTPGVPGAVALGSLTALAWLLGIRAARRHRRRCEDPGRSAPAPHRQDTRP